MSPRAGLSRRALVVTLALVALFAAVAAWQVGALRWRTQARELRDELRGLAVAQESYFYDHRIYAGTLEVLVERGYRPRPDARIVVHEATAGGWSATAVHRDAPVACALFVRDAAPVGVATAPGVIRCG